MGLPALAEHTGAALNIFQTLRFLYNLLWRLVVRIGKTQGTLKVILPSLVDFISGEFDFMISEPRTLGVQIESVAQYLKQLPVIG